MNVDDTMGRYADYAPMTCGVLLAVVIAAPGCERGQRGDATSVGHVAPALNQATSVAPASNRAAEAVEDRHAGKPVTVSLRVASGRVHAGSEVAASVLFEIGPGWEIRTLDAQPESTATRLELELPTGISVANEWEAPPAARSLAPDGHAAYAASITFSRALVIASDMPAGKYAIACRVSYQVCNEQICLQPAAVELKVDVDVE